MANGLATDTVQFYNCCTQEKTQQYTYYKHVRNKKIKELGRMAAWLIWQKLLNCQQPLFLFSHALYLLLLVSALAPCVDTQCGSNVRWGPSLDVWRCLRGLPEVHNKYFLKTKIINKYYFLYLTDRDDNKVNISQYQQILNISQYLH